MTWLRLSQEIRERIISVLVTYADRPNRFSSPYWLHASGWLLDCIQYFFIQPRNALPFPIAAVFESEVTEWSAIVALHIRSHAKVSRF